MKQIKLAVKSSTGSVLVGTLAALGMMLLLVCAILWPFAFIWALNTLFAFAIDYTFWNWLACWILIFTFQGAINIKREKAK